MYCVECHYDLRGQTSERCPECGSIFDRADSATFYATYPTRLKRFRRWAVKRRRNIWVMVGLSVAFLWWRTLDQLPIPIYRLESSIVSNNNLRGLLTTWMLDQNSVGHRTSFDRDRLKQGIKLSFSAFDQPQVGRFKSRIDRWYRSGFAFLHLGSLLLLFLLVIGPARGTTRRALALPSCLIILILIDSLSGNFVLDAVFPGTLIYVDDYVFLPDADLISSNPQRGSTIVAYERIPSMNIRRWVGFGDGHLARLPDRELIPLLTAQGDQIAVDAVPTSPP